MLRPLFLLILFPFLLVRCERAPEPAAASQSVAVPEEPPSAAFPFPPKLDYLSATPEPTLATVPDYNVPDYYFIGWSPTGEAAYLEHNDAGISTLRLRIQDLRTDELLTDTSFEWGEVNGTSGTAEGLWEENAPAISALLKRHAIVPLTQAPTLRSFPFRYAGHTFTVGSSFVMRDAPEEPGEIDAETVTVYRNGGDSKDVSTENFAEYDSVLASGVIGCLKSPFEERVALVKVRNGRGFEGRALLLSLIGCDLNAF